MRSTIRRWAGLPFGMGVTSASLSSGFIWACGSPCVSDPIVWTPGRHEVLVFLAAFTAWWGYLIAHWAWTGKFVDASAHDEDTDGNRSDHIENAKLRQVGTALGAGILVGGMIVGVIYIRQGNHLLTNVGGVLFLGGFIVAHYVETGKPL